jgi:transposase-like protein
MEEHLPICTCCYAVRVEPHRAKHERPTCMQCGEKIAQKELKRKSSMCQPINKSAPTYISDLSMLMQLNPKRTT